MAGELGLKNNYRERVYYPLMQQRGNEMQGGRESSVVEFMRSHGHEKRARQAHHDGGHLEGPGPQPQTRHAGESLRPSRETSVISRSRSCVNSSSRG